MDVRLEVQPPFDRLASELGDAGFFDWCMCRQGEVFRDFPERRTLRFEHEGERYFIKIHTGVGWREIIKNLLYLRPPVLGAGQELRAIRRLGELGLDTMQCVAFGVRGANPARRQSFLITRELADKISLEDLCMDWGQRPPAWGVKQAILHRLAGISRVLHAGGMNHRDYYLCHFLLDRAWSPRAGAPRLYLIDLHRAQVRTRTPRRWRVKDIGGLYFSAMDTGLTRRDLYRFMRAYAGKPLRETLVADAAFWRQVGRRANRLYRSFHGRAPAARFR